MAAGAAAAAMMSNRRKQNSASQYVPLTPEESFQGWMSRHFVRASSNKFYTIIPNSRASIPDPFAFAAGAQDRDFFTENWDVLDELCKYESQSKMISKHPTYLWNLWKLKYSPHADGQLGYYATSDKTDMDGDIQVMTFAPIITPGPWPTRRLQPRLSREPETHLRYLGRPLTIRAL